MKKFALILAVMVLTPIAANAQTAYQFQRGGVFDCSQNGGQAPSVGSMTATGGVYVPVADATVELNTGILVYKECVLREVVDSERQSAMSGFLTQQYSNIMTGRNGNPLYAGGVNLDQETLDVENREVLANLQNGTLSNLNPALQQNVTHAVAQEYEQVTRNQNGALNCPYNGDLNALDTAQPNSFSWVGLEDEGDPACNTLGAYYLSDDLITSRSALAMGYQEEEWNWGQGFYARTSADQNPLQDPLLEQVVTPSSVVSTSFEQILQSPIQQLQSANDIGQMIGALYAGVTTQVVGDSQGLSGLSQSVGGQPSYLSQVAQQSQADLQSNVANAVLESLQGLLETETTFYNAENGVATALLNAINSLQGFETQCWTQIIPKVCSSALTYTNSGATCTDANGDTLNVATSSAWGFTQNFVADDSSQLGVQGSAAALAASSSAQNIQVLNALVSAVTSGNQSTISTATDETDQLVANGSATINGITITLHNIAQASTASTEAQNVQQSITNTVSQTEQSWNGIDSNNSPSIAWSGKVYPGAGWCNTSSVGGGPATILSWISAWQ